LVDYAATAVSAFPFPFPGFERPQATFAILPSTSIPPWADRPSAVLSARERVLKLTNAQSGISPVLSVLLCHHLRCASKTLIDLISVGLTHGQVKTNEVLT